MSDTTQKIHVFLKSSSIRVAVWDRDVLQKQMAEVTQLVLQAPSPALRCLLQSMNTVCLNGQAAGTIQVQQAH